MDHLLTHDEAQEMLGAYAVHALEPDEQAQVVGHLQDCATCSEELDLLLDASAAFGMTEIDPPSVDLWERIRASVHLDDAFDADAAHTTTTAPVGAAIADVIAIDAAREHRRERRSRWRIAVASAAAAAAVAVPATLTFGGSSAPSLAALAKDASGQADARTVALLDNDGKQLAEAVLTANGQGYVRDSTLPKLPDGKTYQLWFIDDGVAVSSGLLGQAPKVSAFAARANIDAIAISVEPSTGSLAPTTTPIAVGALT